MEYCLELDGLVRAYSEATNIALEKANFIQKDLGNEVTLEISYQDLQKLKYYFEKNNIEIINQEFGENVKINFEISSEKLEKLSQNKENLNFKFSNLNIIKQKYINI